ncbi:MAG: ribose-phosphate pyrophosphokinase, partial [Christensenellaceae bacterium]|nr:ribose-phosphate pyrophosphokinase [Christensenellaceae bacterium]
MNKGGFNTQPYGPLGLVAMKGYEDMGAKINKWLMEWSQQEDKNDKDCDPALISVPGYERKDFLIENDCPRFGTGEGKGFIKSTVRGYDLFFLCDVGAYNCTFNMYGKEVSMSPDDHFQDLKRLIAAAGGRARRLNVIMPLLYEGRQHRRSTRESLDCALALQELANMDVVNIITFDAHDPRVQNAIPLHGFDSVKPSYQILKALFREVKDLRIDKKHMMIVSPDEGAMDRNIFYSEALGIDLGMFYKRRDYTRIVDGRNPIVAHEYLGDSVEGKDVFVSDDIIASGDSMLDLAKELKKNKARRIFAAATFALFTNGLDKFHKAYEEGTITKVISTNLTYSTPELQQSPWYIQADMSKYIAYLIATINHDRSISKLLDPTDRITSLLKQYRIMQRKSG